MMNKKKFILFFLISFSFVICIPFLDYSKLETSLVLFLANLFGYWGLHMISWQFFLLIRTPFTTWFEDLVFLNTIHKNIGKFGILSILLHPIFLFIFYSEFGINVLTLSISSEWDIYKLFGQVALYIILFIWVTSALLRSKMTYRIWKRLHLLSYFIVPLVFTHSILFSKDDQTYIKYYALVLFIILVLAYFYRLLQVSGLLKHKCKILEVIQVANNTKEIKVSFSKAKNAKPGQFVYVQLKRFGEEHPFTVSFIDVENLTISITVKATGEFSKKLNNLDLSIDKYLFLDGPYGVFTREIYNLNDLRDIVLIAGGIGITPFLEIFRNKGVLESKKVFLFYFNRTEKDIAYYNFFSEVERNYKNVKIVNVLSSQENYSGEKGFFSVELVKKYKNSLDETVFFVCGPPKMMEMVFASLKGVGVLDKNIFSEKFSY